MSVAQGWHDESGKASGTPDRKRQVNNIIEVAADPGVVGEAILHRYEVEHARRPVCDIKHVLRAGSTRVCLGTCATGDLMTVYIAHVEGLQVQRLDTVAGGSNNSMENSWNTF